MASPEVCPEAERLDAWLRGSLPADEREMLVAHLDACPSCREKLDRLLSAAEILGGLTPGAGDAGRGRGPALSAALASLKRDVPENAMTNQTTEHVPAVRNDDCRAHQGRAVPRTSGIATSHRPL